MRENADQNNSKYGHSLRSDHPNMSLKDFYGIFEQESSKNSLNYCSVLHKG